MMAKPPPDVEFTAVLEVAARAMRRVFEDREVWRIEACRENPPRLPWPLASTGKGAPQLLRWLASWGVENATHAWQTAHGLDLPADPESQAFQLVLRVVHRAVVAADADMRASFGSPRGEHRIAGKREFFNWLKASQVEHAVKSGAPRADALRKLPISRASAYRAMKRR